jgi:hypothetical protein
MSRRRSWVTAGRGLVVLVVAAWLALVEVFWLPLHLLGVPFPLSVVAAVAGNMLLPSLAVGWSGSRLVAVLPGITWLGIALAAMVRRPEGDLILTGTGTTGVVGLVFLLVGALAAAVATGSVLGRR